jgi:ABC-type branched-subunit amino acid transport system permease subunit
LSLYAKNNTSKLSLRAATPLQKRERWRRSNSHSGSVDRCLRRLDPTRWRVLNFAVACVFADGLGGLYAQYFGMFTPDVLNTFHTIEVLAADSIGSKSSHLGWSSGSVSVDVFFIERLHINLVNLPGLQLVIFGLLLIYIMIYFPGGNAELLRSNQRRLKRAST